MHNTASKIRDIRSYYRGFLLCLATKLAGLPIGLFIWLMIFILGFCVFNQRWSDFGIAVLIMVGVYAILFAVELLKAMLDGLMGLIRAI